MYTELLMFVEKIKKGEIDLYNEFGLQFELAIYLRGLDRFNGFKIELERPIGFFGIQKTNSIPKKEIDLCAYNPRTKERYRVEIKFSNNGQVPLQMFKFCEDICFLEHLKQNNFKKCYSLVVVGTDGFFQKKVKVDGIYKYFRGDTTIHGTIICPTGIEKGKEIFISGSYKPIWNRLTDTAYYYLLAI